MTRLLTMAAAAVGLCTAATALADCTVYTRTGRTVISGAVAGLEGDHAVNASCDHPNDILLTCRSEPTPCAESQNTRTFTRSNSGQCTSDPVDCTSIFPSAGSCRVSRQLVRGGAGSADRDRLDVFIGPAKSQTAAGTHTTYCRRHYSVENFSGALIAPSAPIEVAVTAVCLAVP